MSAPELPMCPGCGLDGVYEHAYRHHLPDCPHRDIIAAAAERLLQPAPLTLLPVIVHGSTQFMETTLDAGPVEVVDERGRYVCPRCGRASAHPTDVVEQYCGACREQTGPQHVHLRAAAGMAVGQCGGCGVYRLDGRPPVMHRPGCSGTVFQLLEAGAQVPLPVMAYLADGPPPAISGSPLPVNDVQPAGPGLPAIPDRVRRAMRLLSRRLGPRSPTIDLPELDELCVPARVPGDRPARRPAGRELRMCTPWWRPDGTPIDTERPGGWEEADRICGSREKRVARTSLYRAGTCLDVSTVFLGLDHGFTDGPPVLWETMIFQQRGRCGRTPDRQWRYASREAALSGHRSVLAALRAEQVRRRATWRWRAHQGRPAVNRCRLPRRSARRWR